jgi:hypothetical protein
MEIDFLCDKILAEQEKESLCKSKIKKYKEDIINLMEDQKIEGTVNQETDLFKITVNHKLNRKLDITKYDERYLNFMVMKETIDLKKLRLDEHTYPELVNQCITTSIGTPQFLITRK